MNWCYETKRFFLAISAWLIVVSSAEAGLITGVVLHSDVSQGLSIVDKGVADDDVANGGHAPGIYSINANDLDAHVIGFEVSDDTSVTEYTVSFTISNFTGVDWDAYRLRLLVGGELVEDPDGLDFDTGGGPSWFFPFVTGTSLVSLTDDEMLLDGAPSESTLFFSMAIDVPDFLDGVMPSSAQTTGGGGYTFYLEHQAIVNSVPEPLTAGLFTAGLGIVLMRRRRDTGAGC